MRTPEGRQFMKYWDSLPPDHDLKRDGPDGVFKIFYFMSDKLKFMDGSLEKSALKAFRGGDYSRGRRSAIRSIK